MPLAGVLCPIKEKKDYERYNVKEKRFDRFKKVSLFECKHCKFGHECGFPQIIRRKYLFPGFSHKQDKPRVSVTKITGCLRKAYFDLTQPYYMNISGFIATNVGTAVHKYFEKTYDKSELYIEWETPKGNVLTGFVDHINVGNDELIDLKTTSYGEYKRKTGPSKLYELQLQIYATMIEKVHGVKFKKLKIITIGLGDKECAEQEVPMKDMSDFINERTDYLYECIEKGVPPECKPTEEWEHQYCFWQDECNKVMK